MHCRCVMKATARRPPFALVLVCVLGCGGVPTWVRDDAAFEMRCPDDRIGFVYWAPRRDPGWLVIGWRTPRFEPGVYFATGCGKQLVYVCDRWDSFDQAPACRPARAAELRKVYGPSS